MQDLIQQLKNKPIVPNPNFKFVDYWQNKAYYQQEYINLLKEEVNPLNNEPLVNVSDFGLTGENYYFKKRKELTKINPELSILREIYLRKSVATGLEKIDSFLKKNGLCLYLLSGYRSKDLQQAVLNHVSLKENSQDLKNMLASPDSHLPHATGAAFDVEIMNIKTQLIIPTKTKLGFDRGVLENKKDLSVSEKEVRDNRRLLHHLLTSNMILGSGEMFIPHPFEYWHYSRFEKLAAFFSGQDNYPILYPHVNKKQQ